MNIRKILSLTIICSHLLTVVFPSDVLAAILSDYVILAQNKVNLAKGSQVKSGFVGVNSSAIGKKHAKISLDVDMLVTTEKGVDLIAASARLGKGARVKGNIRYSDKIEVARNVSVDGQITQREIQAVVIPESPSCSANPNRKVLVKMNRSANLLPGKYGPVVVGKRGQLILKGGEYHFSSLTAQPGAKIYIEGPATVCIERRLITANFVEIKPKPGVDLTAADLIVFVNGTNSPKSKLKAVQLGVNNIFMGQLQASHGSVAVAKSSKITGTFLADVVLIGPGVEVVHAANQANFPSEEFTESANGLIKALPEVTGEEAGYLPGGFGVNEAGGATYAMPLAIPPGTSGVAPKLSLSYDSRGGNSILGVGWSLSGLSAISRCPSTIAQDGEINDVSFDNEDKFCLDGQRLVAVNGTYGADKTEYRTENETFSRVYSYQTAGNGPARFTVETKSGLTYSYGNSADSRVEAKGRTEALLWLADRVEDTVGNYFTISYHEDNDIGESYPARIDYTGNNNASLTPYNSVRFTYESRDDTTPRFIAGSKIQLTKRLQKVEMFTDDDLAWEYELNYEQGPTKRSRLISIEECDGDGVCLSPTTFDWQETEEGLEEQTVWFDHQANDGSNMPHWMSTLSQTNQGGQYVYTLLQDMNGDGRPDRVSHKYENEGPGIWVAFNDGKGGFDEPNRWYYTSEKVGSNMPGWNGYYPTVTYGYTRLTDMNGDGLADLVQPQNYELNEAGLWVGLNNGSGFDQRTKWSALTSGNQNLPELSTPHGIKHNLMDMNGDGLPDRVMHYNYDTNENGLWVSINTGSGFKDQALWFEGFEERDNYPLWISDGSGSHYGSLRDMNGDGLTDKVSYLNAQTKVEGMWVALNNGDGFDEQTNWWASTAGNQNFTETRNKHGLTNSLIDMNGDGLADHVSNYNYTRNKDGMWVAFNNGQGFEPQELWYEGFEARDNMPLWISDDSGNHYSSLMDFNGDGLPDKVSSMNSQTDAKGLWVALNNGHGFEDPITIWNQTNKSTANFSYWQAGRYTYTTMMDMDGDGRLDRVGHYNYDTGTPSLWVALNKNVPELLIEVTNGHGAATSIEYEPLTSDDVYTKDSNAVYPARDVQGPMYVVSAYETLDGIGGTRRMEYHYEGLKMTVLGRVFCGFRKITVTDEQTGIETATFYKQAHPYKSMAYKQEVRLSDATLMSRTEDVWSVKNFDWGGYFPHVEKSMADEYEIDGELINTTTTTKTYDNYGNATKITVTQSDGHTETTTNVFEDDTDNWFLGRLTQAKMTKKAPGQSAITRASSFEYDPDTGVLIKEVIQPDDKKLSVTKKYTFDYFGNILTSTTSGSTILARVTTTQYDERGQFVVKSINALGHSETRGYDARHAKVTKLTGPNGITSRWQYDGFGHPVLETRADGTQTRTLKLMAQTGAPDGAVYFIRVDSSGVTPMITYYDILDREIRREAVGFDGKKIFVDTEYNSLGQVVKSSDPYFKGDAPKWTVNEYDKLGRPVKITSPGNRVSKTVYDGLTTTVINPLNQKNIHITNSLGRLVESRDNINNSVYYTYDSFGNLIELEDSAGNITSMRYDVRGNKIQMTDPDSGTTTYSYDELGQLTSQTDAKNQTVIFEYDKLGRMTSRAQEEGIDTFQYDSRPMGIGKLAGTLSADGNHEEEYYYDALGRLSETNTVIDGATKTIRQTYDQYSRSRSLIYPTGFALTNHYNALGYLSQVRDAQSDELYWQADVIDARGALLENTLGNGLVSKRVFDADTGFIKSIKTEDNTVVQNLNFQFDAIGNLIERQDARINAAESFTYDALNRLTEARVTGETPLTMTYDDLGNITSMSSVGNYVYAQNGAGPHAVTSIIGTKANTYAYDANGNRTKSLNGAVVYTSYNKPEKIIDGKNKLMFFHDASHNRYKQTFGFNGKRIKTKLYVGGIYEREYTQDNVGKDTHYIKANGSTVAIFTKTSNGQEKLAYLHKDHLGSIQTITDESGNVLETLSFDAWGNRRNAANWKAGAAPTSSMETDRGFTGHEQLDTVGLIHMNGRVYDPVIGRFLSADPNIQAPENTQNLNRYSYVLNNPLSYTDPSGFFFSKIFKALKRIVIGAVIIVAAFYAGPWVAGAAVLNLAGTAAAVVSAAVSGFVSTAANTIVAGGSISDALSAGARGAAIASIAVGASDGLFGGAENFTNGEKILINQTAGAATHLASGGKMDHSFFSNTLYSIAQGYTAGRMIGIVESVKSSSSGTVSQQNAGKSTNAASTEAFEEMVSGPDESGGSVPIPRPKPAIESGGGSVPIPARKPDFGSVPFPPRKPSTILLNGNRGLPSSIGAINNADFMGPSFNLGNISLISSMGVERFAIYQQRMLVGQTLSIVGISTAIGLTTRMMPKGLRLDFLSTILDDSENKTPILRSELPNSVSELISPTRQFNKVR